jgi:hypothetical protein
MKTNKNEENDVKNKLGTKCGKGFYLVPFLPLIYFIGIHFNEYEQ